GGEPFWAVLQSTGSVAGTTFEVIDAQIPFEPQVLQELLVTLADKHGPRVGDVDGDGAQDVVIALGEQMQVFRSTLGDEDMLETISDGMTPLDPGDPGYLPSVS